MNTPDPGPEHPSSAYEFSATGIDGTEQPLDAYRGKIAVVVNTASQCGFTPQYAGLEELQRGYAARGFTVLGFPCDQFGNQESGSEEEIAAFCESGYGVTFPLFAKIEVNGPQAHPLYQWLKSERSGALGSEAIKWNFTKFLLDSEGRPVKRYAPQTAPKELIPDIEALLDK